ncbi:putative glycosyltransferase EpsJ [Stieleria bergensis]|uniref:Putative glycosyltransferase EpsJ n=1 Tax=Stieleria bergensis TaxID=2528025 RepID=A0A517SXN3_9BACT|nr:putative glycosyltransferase EpsJ [Planctomycetes bacterium SV_7m_r]
MTRPAISVIIPCYNREEILPRAIASVLNQSVAACEIIVVDDGSSDRSAQVAAELHSSVQVITQKNGGAASARNAGIEIAQGDWIAFLDSDDEWHRSKLEKQLAAAERYEQADLIFCDTETIDDQGVAMPSRFALGGVHQNTEVVDGHYALMCEDLFPHLLTNSRVITSAVLVRNGLRDLHFAADIWGAEDWYLWMVLSKNVRFAVVDEVLVTMYQQGDNISGKKGRLYRNCLEVLRRLEQVEPDGSELQRKIQFLCRETCSGAIYFSILAGETQAARELIRSEPNNLSATKKKMYSTLLTICPSMLRQAMRTRKSEARW